MKKWFTFLLVAVLVAGSFTGQAQAPKVKQQLFQKESVKSANSEKKESKDVSPALQTRVNELQDKATKEQVKAAIKAKESATAQQVQKNAPAGKTVEAVPSQIKVLESGVKQNENAIFEEAPLKTANAISASSWKEQRDQLRAEHKTSLKNASTEGPLRAPITDQILFQGFEGTTGVALPANWTSTGTVTTGITATTNGAWMTTGTTVRTGTRAALINLNAASPAQNFGVLWSPDFILEAGKTYEVEIWIYWGQGTSTNITDALEVDVYKGPGANDDEHIVSVVNAGPFTNNATSMPQGNWTRFSATFTAAGGNDYYIEIVAGNVSFWMGGASGYRGGNLRLDDIKVQELTKRSNDLKLSYTFPMTQVPKSQTIMPLATTVSNIGVNPQSNVIVSATNNSTAIGESATVTSLAAGATQTFTITPTAKFAVGANTMVLTASQTETDDDPSDNVVTNAVTGTNETFAADINAAAWIVGSASAVTQRGNIFTITENVTLNQVSMRFNNAAAVNFNINLYNVTPGTLTVGASAVFSSPQSRTASQATGTWHRFTVPATPLAPGTYYLEAQEVSTASNMNALAQDAGAGLGFSYSRSGTALTQYPSQGAMLMRMIVDLQPNDLQIVANNPFLYTQVPASQLAAATVPASLVATARNEGLTPQTVVNFSATFNGANFGPSNNIASIASGATSANMTIAVASGAMTLPTTSGVYPLVYTLSQNETPQADPAKGTVTFPFIVGDVFAKDAVTTDFSAGVGFTDGTGSAGNIFTISESTWIKQVQVAFANGSPMNFTVSLYRATSATAINAAYLFQVPVTRTTIGWNTFNVPETELLPGNYYLCIDQIETNNMSLCYDPTARNSTRLLTKSLTGTSLSSQTSFGAGAVRMVLGDQTIDECAVTEFPYTEGFEDDDTVLCWNVFDVDGDDESWELTTARSHSGDRSMFHPDTYGEQDGWLVSPKISIPATDTYLLTFWSYNVYPAYYGKNSVLISTGSNDPASGDFIEVWSPTSVSDSWVESEVDLTSYAGEDIYIAFRYEGDWSHAWYMDDVKIKSFVAAVDLSISEVILPTASCSLSDSETIGFVVTNNGFLASSGYTINYTIAGVSGSETFGGVGVKSSVTVYLAQTFDFSAFDTYPVSAFVVDAADNSLKADIIGSVDDLPRADNNATQQGWQVNSIMGDIANAKYLIIETDGPGDNVNGFGGIQFIFQGSNADPAVSVGWTQKALNGGWTSIARANGKTISIAIDLKNVMGADYDNFIQCKDWARIILGYYGGASAFDGLTVQKAYLTDDFAMPTGAINLSGGTNWGSIFVGAVTDAGSVKTSVTNRPPLPIPFINHLESEADVADFYFNGNDWAYFNYPGLFKDLTATVEDSPLFTRCIDMAPGIYNLNFGYMAGVNFFGWLFVDDFEVRFGKSGTDISTWEVVAEFIDEYTNDEYAQYETSLTVSEAGLYQVAFVPTYLSQLAIESIEITLALDHDVAVKSVTSSLAAYTPVAHVSNTDLTVTVKNLGQNSETFDVQVLNGTEVVGETTVTSLNVGATETIVIPITLSGLTANQAVELIAKAVLAADENLANNEATYTINVTEFTFATENLAIAEDGIGADGPISFGNVYTLNKADVLTSISALFYEDTSIAGVTIGLAVYPVTNTTTYEIGSAVYESTAKRTKGGLVTFELTTPLALEAGTYYFEIQQLGATNIALAFDGDKDGMFFLNDEDGTIFPFLYSYGGFGNISLRANVQGDVAIEVVDININDGDTDVDPELSIVVTFNQNITSSNLSNIQLTSGATVVALTPSIADNVLTIAHDKLEALTTYDLLIPAGTIDGFDAEIGLSFTTGLGEGLDANALKAVSVYPNPAKGVAYISYVPANSVVRIQDFTGKTIQTLTQLSGNDVKIDIPFASGVYFIQVESKDAVDTYRLIVK
ncbi:MAG: choice-of-anchor J domain-containing protein [Dysgonamonadaceae bacterium]|jgi:hypothetical protein|nr:choice-of-anchor J domain-containing protein [Dysgonamonadaceae bacterium]